MHKSKTSKNHFTLHLHRTGDIFRETTIVLPKLSCPGSWGRVKANFLSEGILQKGSRQTEIGILNEIKRRYIHPPKWLPGPTELGRFLSKPLPQITKNQSLFVYTYHKDLIIQSIFNKVIAPALANSNNFILRNSIIVEELDKIKYKIGAHWSISTLKKWTVKFKTMLRQVGFLRDNMLTKPYIREEAFGFFLFWLFINTQSIKKSLEHKALTPLYLTQEDKIYLLKKGNEKEWWYYTEGGGVIEFIPKSAKLEEWINGLG